MISSPLDRVFLSARWRSLVMLNWEIDPDILRSEVPFGTELDFFEGRTFVSIVGFLFDQTRLLGVPIPFHRQFEELNLRFYVARREQDEFRRGVAFISELVPKWAIAYTARRFYNEHYISVPMKHQIEKGDDGSIAARYQWMSPTPQAKSQWSHVAARGIGPPVPLEDASLEQFIAEHYWGYSQQRNGSTFEYQVKHPAWRVWPATEVEFQCDVEGLYGAKYSEVLNRSPDSAFIADGSAVTVSFPRRIQAAAC
jgi:uncharacterized protein YqjF (DUF2071 family)